MSSGGRLVLGSFAALATFVVAALLIGGGEAVTIRGPYMVQLPENTSPIIQSPVAIAPTPTPLPTPPVVTPPLDPGIWSTPAQFAPSEGE